MSLINRETVSRPVTVVAQTWQVLTAVLATNCMTADALPKMLHADPLRALPVWARFGAPTLMIERDDSTGDGHFFASSPAALHRQTLYRTEFAS